MYIVEHGIKSKLNDFQDVFSAKKFLCQDAWFYLVFQQVSLPGKTEMSLNSDVSRERRSLSGMYVCCSRV